MRDDLDAIAEREAMMVESRARELSGTSLVKSTSENTAPEFKLRSIGELLIEPAPPDFLIDHVLESNTNAAFIGASGGGKSFAAVDMSASVATGSLWNGHATKCGLVIYLAGEGHRGLRRRFKAWSIAKGIDLSAAPLFLSDCAFPINNAIDTLRTTEAIERIVAARGGQPPVAIFIDTLHRHFAGDESSAEDMGTYIINVDEYLRRPFGCTVVTVHHVGHGATDRARGSSAFRAALDWEYLITRTDRHVNISCTKSKDFDPPDPAVFELSQVELPWLDADGKPCTSAVLRPTTAAEPVAAARGSNQVKAIEALQDLIKHLGQQLTKAGGDPDTAQATVDEWREWALIDARRWPEVKRSLVDRRLVRIEGRYVSLAGLPK